MCPHQLEICSTLRRLCDERGLTVVIVSHDLNLASRIVIVWAMLRAGQVRRVGAPAEAASMEVLREVYGCEVLIDAHPQSGFRELRCRARVCRLVDEVVRCCEGSRPAPRVQ